MVGKGVEVRKHQIQELVGGLTLVLLGELAQFTRQRHQTLYDVTLELEVECLGLWGIVL